MEWKKLAHMPQKKIKKLQDKLVRNAFRNKVNTAKFYRDLYEREEINLSKIKTTEDLQKLPMVSKKDYLKSMEEQYDFLCKAPKKLISHHPTEIYNFKPVHVTLTAGRSTKPIPVMYSSSDLELLKEDE